MRSKFWFQVIKYGTIIINTIKDILESLGKSVKK